MKSSGAWRAFIVIAITMVLSISIVPVGMGQTNEETNSGEPLPEPDYVIGGDLIVSFDEESNFNDALHPSVATPPAGSPNDGMIFVVWDEIDETNGYKEIHFSKSEDGGLTWSNDLSDFVISDNRDQKANSGDAVNPTIAVDLQGWIHVVWSEQIAIDGTWEVMYTRSEDDGKSWTSSVTGDVMVSHRYGGRLDADIMSTPEISVGIVGGKADPGKLHVVWSEMDDKFSQQEIRYSRSFDSGNFWTGIEIDDYISIPDGTFAFDPSITITGVEANFIHVTWTQVDQFGFDEIWHSTSDKSGDKGTWGEEKPISATLNDNMDARDASICGDSFDNLYVVWKQYPHEKDKASPPEIYYSFYNGVGWSGVEKDMSISFEDGYEPYAPKISMSDKIVQVVWTEIDETSPRGTQEIHTSWSENPMDPQSWTGSEYDIVLSNGDEWGPAHANNVSFEYANLKGTWKPVFVWDELNDGPSGKDGENKAEGNFEIHTEPVEWTLSTSTSGSGFVTKNPNQATYTDGTSVQLTATPSAGWTFSSWGGDLSGSTNPQTIIMNSDKSVIAYFTEDQYTLTISVVGNGAVSKNPNQATYTYGTSVELTATPDFGWEFDQWGGDLSSIVNPDSLTIYGNSAVTCYFTEITHDIALTSGWNMVSIPLQQANTSIATVLSSISGQYDVVKYYDTTDANDPWKTYRVGSTNIDLTNIDHKMAFWIHTTTPCALSATGEYAASTAINLYTGWNFVGYPTADTTKTVTQALTGTGYDMIEGYDAGGTYLLKTLAGTDIMTPGAGYWIHVPSDTVWTVNW